MRELFAIRVRTGVWLQLPIVVVGFIPWWILWLTGGNFQWQSSAVQWLGAWFMLNGLGLAGWCVNLFNVEGRGTPLPFDPPRQFVAKGPYRFVRNPMFLGVFLIVGGEALMFRSRALCAYLAALMCGAHLFVTLWEEPDLRRRFGEAYQIYCRHVPRWIPRLPPTK